MRARARTLTGGAKKYPAFVELGNRGLIKYLDMHLLLEHLTAKFLSMLYGVLFRFVLFRVPILKSVYRVAAIFAQFAQPEAKQKVLRAHVV